MQFALLILAGRSFAVPLVCPFTVHTEDVRQSRDQPAWLTMLLLSHADNFFTPHPRRLLPAERPLSALFSLLFISPSLHPSLSRCFLSHLTFPSSCASSLLPISCTESQSLSATCKKTTKNKRPFLLCRLYLFTLSLLSFQFLLISKAL